MSYMSVLPNCYYGSTNQMGQLAAQYLNNQSLFNSKTILNYLTSALRISVANYQQTQLSNTPIDSPQPEIELIQSPTTQPLSNALELPLSSQENKEINQNAGELVEKSTPRKVCAADEKEARKEPQNPTDDELLFDDREKGLKKNQSSRRQAKKVKETILNDFVVPIPEIDMVETAYLPLFPMEACEMAKKREEILRRKVGCWGDQSKSRKDKRQIRMLSN